MELNELDDFYDELLSDDDSQEVNVSQNEPQGQYYNENLYNLEDDDEGDTSYETEDQDDIITTLLKSKGINPDAIKFKDDAGDIEELSFDELSKEEQLQLLGYNDYDENYGLDQNEVNLINQLRLNKMTVEDYNNYIAQLAIKQYVESVNNQNVNYNIDSLSDDELFLTDLKARVPDITEYEAWDELNAAKSNTNLYEKKISNLRDEYRQREEEILEQERYEQEQQHKQQMYEFEQLIVNTINDNDSFDLGDSSLELTVDDKNELASFILDEDAAGVRYFAKALNDPKTLVKMAWYATKGEEAFNQISDYYKQEIAKAAKNNYNKGYEDAISGKKSRSVVRKSAPSNISNKKSLTINDIDI